MNDRDEWEDVRRALRPLASTRPSWAASSIVRMPATVRAHAEDALKGIEKASAR